MIRVIQLNSEGDPIDSPAEFLTVEQGQKFAEQTRGAPLEWGEEGRFFSLEGMTKEEVYHLGEDGEYPPVRFWISGVEEDGTERELASSDFENEDTIELDRN
jgi:hypothetical protein